MSTPLRLGLFIVATFSMLAIGTFLIGERQFLFSPTYRLNTTFKTVAGLVEGAEVRVGGLHKGIVDRITLPSAPEGDVTVLMKLERSTARVLRVDSVATIETEGLLGAKVRGHLVWIGRRAGGDGWRGHSRRGSARHPGPHENR